MSKHNWLSLIAWILLFSLTGCATGNNAPAETTPPILESTSAEDGLSTEQTNSIAMLNYLMLVSQEIIANKDNRLFLEDTYINLVNNVNLEAVDSNTKACLDELRNAVFSAKMVEVKRKRVQYTFEQNKANLILDSMPNPFEIGNIIEAMGDGMNWPALIFATISTVADVAHTYLSNEAALNSEYMQSNWALSDEEESNFHTLRQKMFDYLYSVVKEYGLSDDMILTENEASEFIEWKNSTEANSYSKVQFLVEHEAIYSTVGEYWLTLARCYCQSKEYQKCLEAFEKYRSLNVSIFKKDNALALAMPDILLAVSEVYKDKEFIHTTSSYLDILIQNTNDTDWALRYFAACKYIELYSISADNYYIDVAFELVKNNVNILAKTQRELNTAYLAPVSKVTYAANATDEQKLQIDNYNSILIDARNVELAPVYEPLLINCQLLFELAKERNITEAGKADIEKLLRGDGRALFLSVPVDNMYSYAPVTLEVKGKFTVSSLSLPVVCLTDDAFIEVIVSNDGRRVTYSDWKLVAVERANNDITEFLGIYSSEKISDQTWSSNSYVEVRIYPDGTATKTCYYLKFEVSNYKDKWFVADTIEFTQVS